MAEARWSCLQKGDQMLSGQPLQDAITRFAASRILVIGDVMLDHFIWGAVRRISPEAPVPIVEVTKETTFPGGAANVARNLSAFTPHAYLMGRVGRDSAAG
jgi:D-beta-D-heptose 7-phosphate kinase/D-beta-D-heptose 1-phosphate adenosyltransferase